jgi:hypothetical protein
LGSGSLAIREGGREKEHFRSDHGKAFVVTCSGDRVKTKWIGKALKLLRNKEELYHQLPVCSKH